MIWRTRAVRTGEQPRYNRVWYDTIQYNSCTWHCSLTSQCVNDNSQISKMAVELTNQEGISSHNASPDKAPLLPLHERPSSKLSNSSNETTLPTSTRKQAAQLLFGAGGIYASFLYYGSLQEDVFRYTAGDGNKFTHAWFLQVLESLANVVFGVLALIFIGLTGSGEKIGWWGGTPNLPKKPFLSSGLSQVCSKGFTSLALANGLSFPVATLAKSGKMAPVRAMQLLCNIN